MPQPIINPAGNLDQDAAYFSEDVSMIIVAGGADITAKQVVAFTGPGTVKLMDISDAKPELTAGVAIEDGVAGDLILVTVWGTAIANVGASDTPQVGLPLKLGAGDGEFTVDSAQTDSDIIGDMAGVCLSTEIDTTSATCFVWLVRS